MSERVNRLRMTPDPDTVTRFAEVMSERVNRLRMTPPPDLLHAPADWARQQSASLRHQLPSRVPGSNSAGSRAADRHANQLARNRWS